MKIKNISCDVCGEKFNFEGDLYRHIHKEMQIGGVPINVWTPNYTLSKENQLMVHKNKKGIFKFQKYLPNINVQISLNEGNTPLISLKNINDKYKADIFIKDETINPSGSFKDRGTALLVSFAKFLRKKKIAIPSSGNAAISLCLYCKSVGIDPVLFIPKNISLSKRQFLEQFSEVILKQDLVACYEDFFKFCNCNKDIYNGFPPSNIAYLQGLKTLSYEIFLQLGRAPDWIVIPCGGGGNFLAQYIAFKDLLEMGLINKLPKFVSVQIKGADPITVGFNEKKFNDLVVLDNPVFSEAESIASDTCFNYFKIMNILRKSLGIAVSVTDQEIKKYQEEFNRFAFSSLSIFAALEKIKKYLKNGETIILVATAKNENR